LSQLVIAWTISVDGITTALCEGRKEHHVKENASAGDIVIDDVDFVKIKEDVENLGQPL
jgi:aryl-alcohol dehydrogenase-like predicted oxidoreductase